MKGGLCIIYTSLLTISVLSSCALFILVVSEALQGEGDNVDLSGLSNVSQKVSIIKDEIPEAPETTTYEPENKKEDIQQQEVIFAETLSVNSVTTDGNCLLTYLSLFVLEVLPLVQFVPAEGISMEEAFDLLERTPLPEAAVKQTNEADILRIDHDLDSSDPFLDKIEEEDEVGVVVCSPNALLRMSPASVVIVQRPPLTTRFYRNMLPELPIATCTHCQNLFYMEDYEIQIVTKGHCPFCRHPPEEINEEGIDDSLLNGSDASTPDSASNGHNTW